MGGGTQYFAEAGEERHRARERTPGPPTLCESEFKPPKLLSICFLTWRGYPAGRSATLCSSLRTFAFP